MFFNFNIDMIFNICIYVIGNNRNLFFIKKKYYFCFFFLCSIYRINFMIFVVFVGC